MKIAINCAFFQPRGGGIAEYIYNLVSNIEKIDDKNEYILYVLKDIEEDAKKRLTSRFRVKYLPYGSSYADVLKRSMFEQRFWSKEETTEKFDLFHSPFFHSPTFKKAKVIITVHDMRFYRFPHTYKRLRYLFLKYKVKKSVNAANHIIAISEFTKNEIIEAYGTPSHKITVIPEAINRERFSLQQTNKVQDDISLLNSGYILSVGHIEPRKNYERLIAAFRKLKEQREFSSIKLVIVGKKDHHCDSVMRMIDKTPDVVYKNFVSHEMLLWLYSHARLFVFPSFYEGFGFPPLEAGNLGVISAVSNVSSIPEVCGDAVAYFNPYDIDEIKDVMAKCLSDCNLRKQLSDNMVLQLDKLSWQRNARQTIELYESVYERRNNSHTDGNV